MWEHGQLLPDGLAHGHLYDDRREHGDDGAPGELLEHEPPPLRSWEPEHRRKFQQFDVELFSHAQSLECGPLARLCAPRVRAPPGAPLALLAEPAPRGSRAQSLPRERFAFLAPAAQLDP